MGGEKVSLFSPFIQAYIDVLTREGRFGMCRSPVRVMDIKSGSSSITKGPCGDRFKITVAYAGYSVVWEVLFNHHCPEEPPDFILGQEEEFSPDIDDIKSLVSWDPADPNSLLNVVKELLDRYQQYQQDILSNMSMLHYEYTTLMDEAEEFRLHAADIEVHVTKLGQKIGPTNFLMRLPIDFAKIPPYMTKDYPGEDSAVLLVTFQTPEGTHGKVTPQLYLSPRVEHCLGGAANLRIPGYPSGGLLIDYVPTVCQLLQNKVDQISQSYQKRKEYISAFMSNFGRGVVEYDVEGLSSISFLMEWHDFFFMISIELSSEFPNQQPTLSLQSVYHQSEEGRPYSKSFSSYPYSPRWRPAEMAERTRTFLLDNIQNFQKGSVTEGTLE